MTRTRFLTGLAVVTGLAIGATSLSVAQDNPIAKRKELMKAVGGAMKTATEMVKAERPYDAAAAAAAMTTMAKGWPEFVKLFPDNSKTGGETTASPKIWEARADFEAKGAAMVKAAEAAAAEAPKGLEAFKTAHAAVGASCGACHKEYRIKK